MADSRLSTVFDFAALRLRPDGTRVPQQPPARATVAVQDARARWIARDAGGSARILKLRRRGKGARAEEEDAGAEEIDISRELARGHPAGDEGGGADADAPSDEDEDEGPSRKRKARRRATGPAAKRRRFEADFDFLAPQPPVRSVSAEGSAPPQTQTPAAENGVLAEPSPDLLKSIHRFASEFYSERGQLLNVSRQYRAERKQARLARQQRKASQSKGKEKASGSKSPTPSSDESQEGSDDGSESDEDEDENEEGGEIGKKDGSKKKGKRKEELEDEGEDSADESSGDEEEADEAGTEEAETAKRRPKTKRRRRSGKPKILPPLVTDMYKVFEGSALMVLGMLVQEHINFLLTPNIPDGWEDEVKRAYTDDFASGEEDVNNDGDIMVDESVQGEAPEGLDEDIEEDEDDEDDEGDEEDEETAEKNEGGENTGDEDGQDDTGEGEDEEGDEEGDEEDRGGDEDEENGDTEDHDGHSVKPNASRIHGQAAETANDVTMELEESDGDSSFEGTSDESMRSDDTVHSDSEVEFS
ncbi:hypothetical protein HYPSUDRAFT_50142 [Hypholoma sublateritium FD-334 SS-4]|uniref:Uncharacterized protein n=1 Tax=Hypholoma sublateritium (strain FD-334 SS-4) TaxID=945553 RepID=A0A0D2PFM4_HYPSF|nr:hypothetical protein HYPSUDRAFT_50142 [Hypholoma sublateritium FD-334 SS-4]